MSNPAIENLVELIEEARKGGLLNNDAARAASVALGLEGDEAMLANRIIAQGADPASIDYLLDGKVSAAVQTAHKQGPGALTGEDKIHWLSRVFFSADESKGSTLRERLLRFVKAGVNLKVGDMDIRGMSMWRRPTGPDLLGMWAERAEEKIKKTTFVHAEVGGTNMRVYSSDFGFAAAYWSGVGFAAVLGVYDGKPYVAVGADQANGAPSLGEVGIKVEKSISSHFGIIESPEAVAEIQRQVDAHKAE